MPHRHRMEVKGLIWWWMALKREGRVSIVTPNQQILSVNLVSLQGLGPEEPVTKAQVRKWIKNYLAENRCRIRRSEDVPGEG